MSLLTQRGIANDASPEKLHWRAVEKRMWVDVLEFLGAHTRANYDRINTWTSTYRVHVEQYLSPAHVKGAFGERVPPEISSGLIQELELKLKVVIDNRSDSIFRETDTTAFRFLVPESRRPVEITDTGPVDQRSIVTPEHYVHFIPENPPTLAAPSSHPAAQNKRAARRVPPEEGQDRHHAELIDPRLFFRCSTPSAFWEEMDMYVSAIKGADGAEKQQMAAERLRIYEAAENGSTWYRIDVLISFPNGRNQTITSVWSPRVAFNPVEVTFSVKSSDSSMVTKSVSWDWTEVDGIFVPKVVTEFWSPPELMGMNSFHRTAVLESCSLNVPLDPDQFKYATLGLEPGELIIDKIDQTVLIMSADRRPERLTTLDASSSGDEEERGGPVWRTFLLIGNALLVIVIALYFAYRRVRGRE